MGDTVDGNILAPPCFGEFKGVSFVRGVYRTDIDFRLQNGHIGDPFTAFFTNK